MKCTSETRKALAEDIIESLAQILKKHAVEDVVIQRDHDPIMLAARGCLGDKADDSFELVMQISADLNKAERHSLSGAELSAEVPTNVAKAFDLSQIVAKDTVASAAPEDDNKGHC